MTRQTGFQPPAYPAAADERGQACVRWFDQGKRKNRRLGAFGSPESYAAYARLVEYLAEQFAAQAAGVPAPESQDDDGAEISVAEMCQLYWDYQENNPRGLVKLADGKKTAKYYHMRVCVQILLSMYADTIANRFISRDLERIESAILHKHRWCPPDYPYQRPKPWSRQFTHDQLKRVRSIFFWASDQGYIRDDMRAKLALPKLLPKGKGQIIEGGGGHEAAAVNRYADLESVRITLPYLSPQHRAIVVLALLSCGRPNEICQMRVENEQGDLLLDTFELPWKWTIPQCKTANNEIRLPEQAMDLLRPFIARKLPTEFLFSSEESWAWYQGRKASKSRRMTERYPNEIKRVEQKKREIRKNWRRKFAPHITPNNLRQAVWRAIQHATADGHDVQHWFPYMMRHTSATDVRTALGPEQSALWLRHAPNSKISQEYTRWANDRLRAEIADQWTIDQRLVDAVRREVG